MQEDYYLSDYWQVVRRHWKALAGFAVGLAVLAVIIAALAVPRQWTSSTTIYFELPEDKLSSISSLPGMPDVGKLASALGVSSQSGSQVASEILTSRALQLEVARRTGLAAKLHLTRDYDIIKFLRDAVIAKTDDNGAIIVTASIAGTPLGFMRSDDDARQLVFAIAKAHTDVLHETLEGLSLTKAQRKAEFLRQRVAASQRELADARVQLRRSQEATHQVLPPNAGNLPPEVSLYATLKTDMLVTQADAQAAEQKLAVIKRELSGQETMVISQVTSSLSGVLDELKKSMAEEQAAIAVLADQGVGPQHPDYRAHSNRLRELKAAYQRELEGGFKAREKTVTRNPYRDNLLVAYAQAQAEAAAGGARASALKSATATALQQVRALPASMQVLGAQVLDVELKSQVYSGLVSAYEMARVEVEEQAPKFEVLDPAFVPEEKTSPSLGKTGACFGALGLLLGLFVIMGVDGGRRKSGLPNRPLQ